MNKISCALNVKEISEDGTLSGYASVFNVVDSDSDAVMKGAFKRSLNKWKEKKRTPAMLWQHNPTQPIGVWDELVEDDTGLVVKGRLATATQNGKEAHELLRLGAVSGLSIGYRTVASKFDKTRNAHLLTDVELFEVSIVTMPANDDARVRVVKAADAIKTERDFEKFLREEGFSNADAATICRRGWKALSGVREERDEIADALAVLNRTITMFKPQT